MSATKVFRNRPHLHITSAWKRPPRPPARTPVLHRSARGGHREKMHLACRRTHKAEIGAQFSGSRAGGEQLFPGWTTVRRPQIVGDFSLIAAVVLRGCVTKPVRSLFRKAVSSPRAFVCLTIALSSVRSNFCRQFGLREDAPSIKFHRQKAAFADESSISSAGSSLPIGESSLFFFSF